MSLNLYLDLLDDCILLFPCKQSNDPFQCMNHTPSIWSLSTIFSKIKVTTLKDKCLTLRFV